MIRILANRSYFAVSCILLFVLLTLVAHKGADRFTLKLDLTENALYEFSDTTRAAVKSLESDLKITVFNREEDYVVMLREVLKRFAALNPRVRLEFIDPFQNPVLVDFYASKNIQVQADDIVLEQNGRIRSFSIRDMYILSPGGTEVTGLQAEQQLVSAIAYLNQESVPLAAFSDGHNERPSRSLKELFTANNFDVQSGTLSSLLSRKPRLLVIAAPSRDFSAEDAALLDRYVRSGGNVLIFMEPSLEPMPYLEAFLEDRGIAAGEVLVLEEQAYTGNNPVNVVPMYDPHIMNTYFMETRIFLTMPSSRNMVILPRTGSALDVRSILSSTPGSFGKKGYSFDSLERTADDPAGPFSLALSSTETLDAGGTSRVVAVGSRQIFADDLMGYSSYGNRDFLVQAVNWLAAEELSVNIPPKNIQAAPLNLQAGTVFFGAIVFCVVIPLIILSAGLLIFIRRRRL